MTRPRALLHRMVAPLLLLGICGVLAGCSTTEGDDVQTMPKDEAKRQVQQLAEKVRTLVAVDAFTQANENVSPCEGKGGELSDTEGVYHIQGIYQLQIPAELQEKALTQVRQQLTTDGLTIKSERSFGPGKGGEVSAVRNDQYTVNLSSGEPPAMLLLVSSPCYRA